MAIERLRAAMRRGPDGSSGYASDWHVSEGGAAASEVPAALMPAAVLMAITDEAEPTLLLTRRQAHLKRHAGQIAFPGGRSDAADVDPVMTALREAEEEVALPRTAVEVLGQLGHYATGTGFLVTPVVGLVAPGLVLTPEAGEVAELFHVPLAHVLDPAHHELRLGSWQGRERRSFVIRYGNREIWGATAGMIVNLSRQILP